MEFQPTARASSLCVAGDTLPRAARGGWQAQTSGPGRTGVRPGGARGAGLGAADPHGRGKAEMSSRRPLSRFCRGACGAARVVSHSTTRGLPLAQRDGADPLPPVTVLGAAGPVPLGCGGCHGRNWGPRQQQGRGTVAVLGRPRCHGRSRLVVCLRIT